MKPTLLALDLPGLGHVAFPSYLTLMMLALITALVVAQRRARVLDIDGRHIVDIGLVCFVAAIFGARLLSVLADGFLRDFIHLCTDPARVDAADAAVRFCGSDADCGAGYLCNQNSRDDVVAGIRRTMCHPPRDCLAALKFWQGGLTFYGGVLCAVPAGLYFARRREIRPMVAADIFAPAIVLAQSIGKVGCYLNGCCYGAQTELGIGVTFPGHAISRHPAQLYEAGASLIIFFALSALRGKQAKAGVVFGAMLMAHSTSKAAIELLRADPRGALGPLSTSQWIAAGLFCAGAYLVFRRQPAHTR